MIVIRKLLYISVCMLLLASCKTTNLVVNDCILDKENNAIIGSDEDAKTFYKELHFLPRSIENFLTPGKKPPIEYSDFSSKVDRENKYAGYHISGCRDTTWAKKRMADHLMDKYHINRYDSTYYDTIYNISVVDESKLEQSKDSCHYLIFLGSTYEDEVVTEIECISWGMVCRSLIPVGMSHKTNSVEGDDRLGYYNIKVPAYTYKRQGFEAYQYYIRDWLGIEMAFDRIEKRHTAVYEYRE